jgi:hypothetical protein
MSFYHCVACSMRVSFSAVRAISKVIRVEAGQRGEGTLQALDLQLPLMQNLREAGQACSIPWVQVSICQLPSALFCSSRLLLA